MTIAREGDAVAVKRVVLRRRRWVWGLMLGIAIAAIVFWAERKPARWELLGVAPLDPLFADTTALLAAGEAHAAGVNPYHIPNRFDVYGRPHVYGPGWLVTGDMGLTVDDTRWLGGLIVGLFIIGAVCMFLPSDLATWGVAFVLIGSPPVLLGINRANNDLVMILMCLAGGWLAGRKEPGSKMAVLVLIGAATLLKFYPVVMGLAAWTLPGNIGQHRRRILWLSLAVVFALALQWDAYLNAIGVVPYFPSIFSYHAGYALSVIRDTLRITSPAGWIGMTGGALLSTWLVFRGASGWWNFLPTTGRWAFITVSASAVWIGCLLAGPSFTYRAVWLLPLCAWAWRMRRQTSASSWLILSSLLLWTALPISVLSDNTDYSYYTALVNVVGFASVLLLVSMLMCFWMLLGWGARRWTELRSLQEPCGANGAGCDKMPSVDRPR